jgi:hypothetical protein
MANRICILFQTAIMFTLIVAAVILSTYPALSAQTYTVPQTTGVTLNWDCNDPSPEGYRIYQRTEGNTYDYSKPVWTGAKPTSTVYNLDYDKTYYFVARAYDGANESGDSNEVSFFSPGASPTAYTISASATDGGSLSPGGAVTVSAGADQTFVITPDTGCDVVDVLVDGVSIGAVFAYTFTQVAANHTISAKFVYNPHTIVSSASTGGSIFPAGDVKVDHGGSQEYTIAAASGYHVTDVIVDGVSIGPVSFHTFDQVVTTHTIHATFSADSVTISSFAGANGTISPQGSIDVAIGGGQMYTIAPISGYEILEVIVDGVAMGGIDSYTFSNVKTNHTISATFAAGKKPPVADAGPNQVVEQGQTVWLSGLNTIDADDGIAAFQWHQIQGVKVALSSSSEPQSAFIAPDVDASGTALVFELSVTDYSGATSVDKCIVNVTWHNVPPVAHAGVDQTVDHGSTVYLDASNSFDIDGDTLSFRWTQLSGPAVVLSDPESATPTFQVPQLGSQNASMTFELTVTDAGGLQDTDRSVVNVALGDNPPIADAGSDQQVTAGQEVALDGSQSTDPDGREIAFFHWRQTAGTPVELFDPTASRPVFIAPDGNADIQTLTFELTVVDSEGLKGRDLCKVHIAAETTAADTTAPSVTIDDPTGDSLTVGWHKVSFSGTAFDDREVVQVVWENSAGGNGLADGTTNWFIERVMLKRGKNVITVTAYDSSGNSGAVSKTLYLLR